MLMLYNNSTLIILQSAYDYNIFFEEPQVVKVEATIQIVSVQLRFLLKCFLLYVPFMFVKTLIKPNCSATCNLLDTRNSMSTAHLLSESIN